MKYFLLMLVIFVSFGALAQEPVAATSIYDKIDSFLDNLPTWLVFATTVVTAATSFTAMTPTGSPNKILNVILRVLNVLSGNVGKNKNADDTTV